MLYPNSALYKLLLELLEANAVTCQSFFLYNQIRGDTVTGVWFEKSKFIYLQFTFLKKILLLQELAEPKTETPKEGYIGM